MIRNPKNAGRDEQPARQRGWRSHGGFARDYHARRASGRAGSPTETSGQAGQLLIEIGIAVGIIATLSAMTATMIIVAQRNQVSARRQDAASALTSEAYSILRSMINGDSTTTSNGYNRIYCPPYGICPAAQFPVTTGKGTSTTYRPVLIGNRWELETGSEQITLAGIQYTRFVTVENVCRSSTGDIVGTWETSVADCPNSGSDTDDPSAQKLMVTLQTPSMQDLTAGLYTTRWRNAPSGQSDWSGDATAASPIGESTIHFQISWSDLQGASERARGFACKTDGVDGINYECPGGTWAESTGWVTDPANNIDLYYTPSAADVTVGDTCNEMTGLGDNQAYLFVCDDEGACSGSTAACFEVIE